MTCLQSHPGFELGHQAQGLGSCLLHPQAFQAVSRQSILCITCSCYLSRPFPTLPGKFWQMPPSPGSLTCLLGDPLFHCAPLEPASFQGNQVLFTPCPRSWGLGPLPTPPTPRSSGSWSRLCCPASEATVSAFSPTVRQGRERPTAWRWERGQSGWLLGPVAGM